MCTSLGGCEARWGRRAHDGNDVDAPAIYLLSRSDTSARTRCARNPRERWLLFLTYLRSFPHLSIRPIVVLSLRLSFYCIPLVLSPSWLFHVRSCPPDQALLPFSSLSTSGFQVFKPYTTRLGCFLLFSRHTARYATGIWEPETLNTKSTINYVFIWIFLLAKRVFFLI